jgi:hypothetical protein
MSRRRTIGIAGVILLFFAPFLAIWMFMPIAAALAASVAWIAVLFFATWPWWIGRLSRSNVGSREIHGATVIGDDAPEHARDNADE